MERRHILGLCMLVLLLLAAVEAHAVAIGVNRGTLHFREVLRGGFAREVLTVTTDSEEPIVGEVIVAGEAAEWLNFSAKVFNFSRDAPYHLAVDIQPPIDAQIDEYELNMSILTGELTRSAGGLLGTTTRASIGIRSKLSMTGTERAECRVGGVQVLDTERGQPMEIQLSIINSGNVRLNPDVYITIQDKYRADTVEDATKEFGISILPTLTKKNSQFFVFDLPADQYWAVIEVEECNYRGLQTFDVLEVGQVKADGEFIRIDAESRVSVGDIVPVNAIFRNRGLGSLRAQFKGTITNIETEEIVKVISTDTYIVDPSVTAELETFFNPQETGRYMVTGAVFYNNKLSRERDFVINVGGMNIGGIHLSGTVITLIVIVIVILILLILIKRRRKQKEGHHRPRG